MMNRRDFLKGFALTGGLWVLGDSAPSSGIVAGQAVRCSTA